MARIVQECGVLGKCTIHANNLLISVEVEYLLGQAILIVRVGTKLGDLTVSKLDLHGAQNLVIVAEQDLTDVLSLFQVNVLTRPSLRANHVLVELDLVLRRCTVLANCGISVVECRQKHVVLGVLHLVVLKSYSHSINGVLVGANKQIRRAHPQDLVRELFNEIVHVAFEFHSLSLEATILFSRLDALFRH